MQNAKLKKGKIDVRNKSCASQRVRTYFFTFTFFNFNFQLDVAVLLSKVVECFGFRRTFRRDVIILPFCHWRQTH